VLYQRQPVASPAGIISCSGKWEARCVRCCLEQASFWDPGPRGCYWSFRPSQPVPPCLDCHFSLPQRSKMPFPIIIVFLMRTGDLSYDWFTNCAPSLKPTPGNNL
jgi:hypothetical protein